MSAQPGTPEQRLLVDICLSLGVPFMWHSPGSLFISGEGAGDVIREVVARGATVLGFDGFEIERAVHPRLDLIYDIARAPTGEDLPTVVARWGDRVWLDVTLSLDELSA